MTAVLRRCLMCGASVTLLSHSRGRGEAMALLSLNNPIKQSHLRARDLGLFLPLCAPSASPSPSPSPSPSTVGPNPAHQCPGSVDRGGGRSSGHPCVSGRSLSRSRTVRSTSLRCQESRQVCTARHGTPAARRSAAASLRRCVVGYRATDRWRRRQQQIHWPVRLPAAHNYDTGTNDL